MLQLFLCPGTIRVTSCPASSQLISSMHTSSGSSTAALFPPLHPLYDSPHAFLHRGPHAFTLQVGQRKEIITVGCLKGCEPWMSRLAAIAAGAAKNPPGNLFSPTLRGGFCTHWPAAPSQPPQRWYPQRHTYED
jgi:hypothetical protein